MAVEMKSGDEIEVKNTESKEMAVIDIKDDQKSNTNSNSNSEKVCRICLESSAQGIIPLGCDCRGELGFSHPECAATWFSIRIYRKCEICGKTAKNIHHNRLVRERMYIIEMEVEVEMEDGAWDPCGCVVSVLRKLKLNLCN